MAWISARRSIVVVVCGATVVGATVVEGVMVVDDVDGDEVIGVVAGVLSVVVHAVRATPIPTTSATIRFLICLHHTGHHQHLKGCGSKDFAFRYRCGVTEKSNHA